MTAFDRVIDVLTSTTGHTPKGNDRTRSARCPAHDDHSPSLSVTRASDRVLIRCQAGCDTADILDVLQLTRADLFDEPLRCNGSKPANIEYSYTDENGALLFVVERRAGKKFLQRRPDGAGGWAWNLDGCRRVLFNLPAVVDAVAAGQTIYICEGEKDALAVERAGAVATCNPGGAGKWRPEYNQALAGAPVVVIADRDEPGRKHATEVADSLRPVAATVTIMEPVVGKDVSDHLAAGRGLDELVEVTPMEMQADPPPPARYVDWATLWADEREGPEWVIKPLIAVGQSAAVYSPAKVGKSLLALEAAAAKATGRPVLGNPAGDPIHVLYVDHENTADDLRDRLADLGYGPDDDMSNLHYSLLADWAPLDTDEGGRELHEAAVAVGARLVILDTVSRAISGDENSADTFLALYRHTGRRLKRDRIAFMRLDHTGKDVTKGQRGSSAKRDDVDVVWSLLPRGGPDSLALRREASRTGQGPEVLLLRRLSGPLRHVVDRFDDAHERDVLRVGALLDGLEVPPDAGRPAAAKALRDHGDSCRTTIIAEAVRRRRATVPTAHEPLSPQARGQSRPRQVSLQLSPPSSL